MSRISSLTILAMCLLLAGPSTFGANISFKYSTESTCVNLLIYQKYSTKTVCTMTVSAGANSAPHKLVTAILLSDGTPIPSVEARDVSGEPLVINRVAVRFEASNFASNRISELHPPPSGASWIGFESTDLIPVGEDSETMVFNIDYEVDGETDETLRTIIWVSNDSDLRNGDMVFGSGGAATME